MNNLKSLRIGAGISVTQLAKRSGISASTITRIETGVGSVRIEHAISLAGILGVPIAAIFPEHANDESTGFNALDRSGCSHRLSLRLTSGREVDYFVSEHEANRVAGLLLDGPAEKQFAVFDTHDHRIALAVHAILALNVLWDPGDMEVPTLPDPQQDHPVLAYFRNSPDPSPSSFDVEPDEPLGDGGDAEYQPGQLAEVLLDLDSDFADRFIKFEDADGEAVLLNVAELITLEVPLIFVEPALYDAYAAQFLG